MPDGVTPLLKNSEMRRLGFTDNVKDKWYWNRRLDIQGKVTLNITIDKDTGFYEELVMNEDFGQPEYYGRMKPEWRDIYRDNIDLYLRELNLYGLDLKVDHAEYGC